MRLYFCYLMVFNIVSSPELLLFVMSSYITLVITLSLLFWWLSFGPLLLTLFNFCKGDSNSIWRYWSYLPVFIYYCIIFFFPLIKHFFLVISSILIAYFSSFNFDSLLLLTYHAVDFNFIELPILTITFTPEYLDHSILLIERGETPSITYPSSIGSPCSDNPIVLGLYNCDKTWVLQNSCVPLPEESDFGWGFTYFTHKASEFLSSLFSTPDARIETATRAARFTLRCFNEINVNHGETLHSLIQYYLDYGIITKVGTHTFVLFSDAYIPLIPSTPTLPPR
jgi:hypothetical protein